MKEAYRTRTSTDIEELSRETLEVLRRNNDHAYEGLSVEQQRPFDELAEATLSHLLANEEAAFVWGKFGSNEEAFGINVAEVDGAVLRVHFYSGAGAQAVDNGTMEHSPINIERFGTPHNHIGHIAAVIPRGELIHHCFEEIDGRDYTAGRIVFEKGKDPKKDYKFKRSTFVPIAPVGLRFLGSAPCNADRGYRMSRATVHVVSWAEPTISVFFNDLRFRHASTIYQAASVSEEIERSRGLSDAERRSIWEEFKLLARS